MNTGEQLKRLFRRWQRRALAGYSITGLAIALPVATLLAWFGLVQYPWLLLAALGIAILAGASVAYFDGFFNRRPLDLAYHLNRRHPSLEDSSDLLLLPDEQLSPLAQLQRARVARQFESQRYPLPNSLPRAFMFLTVGMLLSFIIWSSLMLFQKNKTDDLGRDINNLKADLPANAQSLPPALLSATVYIQPPAYTRRRATSTSSLDIEAPAYSEIRWELQFDQPVAEGRLIAGNQQRVPLRRNENGRYTARLKLEKSNFYALTFRAGSGDWVTTDYYRLEAIPDQPPHIEVEGLAQYVEYPYNADQQITFSTSLSDDYGIRDGRIIATVSRGEGESVKFRDDTLSFQASFKGDRLYQLKKTLRLRDLGMEAGDELYLHIEADDNRRPSPQTAKTFKYIIAFENPETATLDMSGGLAVDRLPEYFRSQRQIIIDTEKLLTREKELDQTTFQDRSNNIAIDQKLLRLRYGRFLGEEFQTVIGEVPESETEIHEHEEGEDHTHEEHPDAGHDHAHEQEATTSEDNQVAELEPYYHTHDITEEVTFFDATTTAKLRAALAEMWNAELHLRMGRPARALPYEYKALKLIKEIQQASRIYVERIGFDPPAIKVAEKRLMGDLEDILSPTVQREADGEPPYPAVAAAIPILETLLRRRRPPGAGEYARLQSAGEELAALAVEEPGSYLRALQQLRSIMEDQAGADRARYLRNLQAVFWSLLPDRQQHPLAEETPERDLRTLFLRELQEGF